MPLVKVEILEGFPDEYKDAILNGIQTALIETFKIPENDQNQKLFELAKKNFRFPDTKYSNQYTHIEISVFQGRSFETKKKLYSKIVELLKVKPGISGNDITIILNEIPLENWGIRGGIPANEVDLGFELNV